MGMYLVDIEILYNLIANTENVKPTISVFVSVVDCVICTLCYIPMQENGSEEDNFKETV